MLSAAKGLTTLLGNEDRDEDRGGPSGFEEKAARARRFAAERALQSYALRAAAEGAVLAYAEVTGETWKAYEAPAPEFRDVELGRFRDLVSLFDFLG
jgi:hypothetical protein